MSARIARLTVTIESPGAEILAEDSIIQDEGESDDHFLTRTAALLGFLRMKSESETSSE
jgi:hypothetical protein